MGTAFTDHHSWFSGSGGDAGIRPRCWAFSLQTFSAQVQIGSGFRQSEVKGGALSDFAFHPDFAAVTRNNLRTYRKPQPDSRDFFS